MKYKVFKVQLRLTAINIPLQRSPCQESKYLHAKPSDSSTGSIPDGSPIFLLKGQELVMFSANSPKLLIRNTFEVTIELLHKRSALVLPMRSVK
ncbi:hypothetical protein [Microcoleus sp.]|uniref:hypothetical protein n=1 Tax=Microcoleus sp. TaxID=44472 RepID=UPI0035238404